MALWSDTERVNFVIDTMAALGFGNPKPMVIHSTGSRSTQLIMFQEVDGLQCVDIFFPNEEEYGKGTDITTQAKFKDKPGSQDEKYSPRWKCLEEFAENIGPWIEERRSGD